MDRASLLDIHDDLLTRDTALCQAHLVGEGGGGLPASRVARVDLLKHLVDLLERKTLGLGDQEVSVDASAGAEGSPDEEDLGAEVILIGVHHIRCYNPFSSISMCV